LGPILDDNTVWYASLDVDRIEGEGGYEFDYAAEMRKIAKSELPVVVFRTKSGGLRVVLFFSEAIEAELAVARMEVIRAYLGYGNCEIFPKQKQLDVANEDHASWIFMPFGPQAGKFPEQCCMNEMGNPMELSESIGWAEGRRISREVLLGLLSDEVKAKANGKANGKNGQKGVWKEEATKEDTIHTMFYDGPLCLWALARLPRQVDQHYFLLNIGTFVKKKYTANWAEALSWANFNVLRPAGDLDHLNAMVKDLKNKTYEYTCRTEPICSHCHATACRRMPFGVGQGSSGVDDFEWGMTKVDRIPAIYIVNFGNDRVQLQAEDITSQHKFNAKRLQHGYPMLKQMKNPEWIELVNKNLEEMVVVPPSEMYETYADEKAALMKCILHYCVSMVRAKGEEFLNGKGGHGSDVVRMNIHMREFYLKHAKLLDFCRRALQLSDAKLELMKAYVEKEGRRIPREEKSRWMRCTYVFRFDQFDDEFLENIVGGGEEKGDE
jgi:hypothetical protein